MANQASVTSQKTLLRMLIIATIIPLFLGAAGIGISLGLSILALTVVILRPDLGIRWYFMAALPLALWVFMLTFRPVVNLVS